MELTYWQLLLLIFFCIAIPSILCLLAVFIGAYAVYRTKHAQTQLPFMSMPQKQDNTPEYYADDIFGQESEEEDEMLSDAAERIRAQKQDKVMDFVTGKRDSL